MKEKLTSNTHDPAIEKVISPLTEPEKSRAREILLSMNETIREAGKLLENPDDLMFYTVKGEPVEDPNNS